MKRYRVLTFCLLLLNSVFAQQKTTFDWSKVNYGGRIGLEVSNNNTSVILAPSAVYRVTQEFSLGGSVSFGYTSFKSNNSKLYNYGVSILSSYSPTRELQLSAELEQNFVNNIQENFENNFNFLALYLGAGYRLGRNVVGGVRYDVLYNEDNNIYTSPFSPFIQVYF